MPDCELEENYLKSCLDLIHSTLSMDRPQHSPDHEGTMGMKLDVSCIIDLHSVTQGKISESHHRKLPQLPFWDPQVVGMN